MKNGSFLVIVGAFLLMIVVGYSGYLFWQNSSLSDDLKVVEKSIKDNNEKLLQRDNETLVKAIAAKETSNDLKKTIIKWSRVIKNIRTTIPKKDGVPIIEALSYSGGNDHQISINVRTLPSSQQAYFDVADLIRSFDNSALFQDTFVPSISAGVDIKGKEVLSFLLSTRYLGEKDSYDGLGEALNEVIDESLEKKTVVPTTETKSVPR